VKVIGGAIWEIGMIPSLLFIVFTAIFSVVQIIKGKFTWSLGISIGLLVLILLYFLLADYLL
jgi:hypothetical protein